MPSPPQSLDKKTIAAARDIVASLPSGQIKIAGLDKPLPPAAAGLLRELLASMAKGSSVGLLVNDREMTPNEAAAHLNVSRGFVSKLMDEGTLPFRQVGSHRRIPVAAVIKLALSMRAQADAAMNELVQLSQEMGLYDDDPRMTRQRSSRKQ